MWALLLRRATRQMRGILGCVSHPLRVQYVRMRTQCKKFLCGCMEAGVHDGVRDNTAATDWAKAKVRIKKSLRPLRNNKSKWLEGFAGAVGFSG